MDVLGDRHPRRHHRLAEPERNVTIDADRAEHECTDTRSGIGGVRLADGQTLAVDFNGVVPGGSNAVAVNVTAVNAAAPGYLTVFPCSDARPNTSTVNFVGNEARPNNTIVGLSAGRICIFSDAATDVLVDLLGSFGAGGLAYLPTPPVRVLDTRRSGIARSRRGGRLQRERGRPRRPGAGCRVRQRHGRQSRRTRLRDDVSTA